MGKKGGKKGKIDQAVENAEPNLPTIPEEDGAEKSEPEAPVNTEAQDEPQEGMEATRSKSILKTGDNELERRKSSRSKSIIVEEGTEKNKNQVIFEGTDQAEASPGVEGEGEDAKKKGKEKKGKKGKKEKADTDEGEEQKEKAKKGKKGKKEKPEESGGEEEETIAKEDSKDKKAKPDTDEEEPVPTSSSEKQQTEPATEEVAEEGTKKKGKKGKKDKGEGDGGEKKKKSKEKKTKKGKADEAEEEAQAPTSRVSASGQLQEGEGDVPRASQVNVTQSQSALLKKSESKMDKSVTTVPQDAMGGKKKKGKKGADSKGRKESLRDLRRSSSRDSDSITSERLDRYKNRLSSVASGLFRQSVTGIPSGKKKTSRLSTVSSECSFETDDYHLEETGKKKKGKKGKKQKGKKEEQPEEEQPEETEEEKERKKAEKLAAKKAKKEAKKAARKEALVKKRAEKAGKGGDEFDELKRRLDELKKIAKELGIDEGKGTGAEGEKKGPKKKVSKKEKAKLTAEMAEKAKADMEAQAKRLEELIKKKKEEDRLAAIEKDKRETIEQSLRMEQLQETAMLIQEIVDTNAEICKEEQELLEWKKYLECGKLPDPAMCNDMNTYLHLWELDLDKTSVDDASSRTADAVKLLCDLDELIDTVSIEESQNLENWKWIRRLFREHQSASLDVATYRLMRDVEHNLNRINIPTADFNFQDEYVTLCLWLRVMLPIPLPNPRRPPKPRVDINFSMMDFSVLFPATIDCEDAAIRAMYLKYDHLSDLSETFNMSDVPQDYYMDLITITKKEWRAKLKYKYDNRDKTVKPPQQETAPEPDGQPSGQNEQNAEQKEGEQEKVEDKKIKFEEPEDFEEDDEIPLVPFKQLKPTCSEHAISIEDQLYDDTRAKLRVEVPEDVINLRKFVILGGVFHLNYLAQPPQPQDFITMDMTITALYLPKKLEVLPFKVIYTPYIPPPDPEPTGSDTSFRKLPEELEEEQKKQEEELDKLIAITVKWPQHVIFLELPIVCRWDEEKNLWSNEEIHDVKHNEDKCMISFRTGVFGIYGLATYRYCNLPFQAYDIKPEVDDSVTVQLTAAILMLEFNIKDGLIAITQLQNSPNMTLQDVIGKYMKLHKLKRMMKEAGIDIFPAFDAFCYVEGCCEKQWAMEQHLYYNMAQISNCFNFAWSRWNLQAGRRRIVLQMRQYFPDKGKQKNHQMLLVTPLKATFVECTEVSQAFTEKDIENLKFCANLYHLMKITSGIFVRNKVENASKQNVYTLSQFLIAIRILSFS